MIGTSRVNGASSDEIVVLVDLALVGIGAAGEYLVERDLAAQCRRLQNCEGAGQVAQALAPACLGIGAAFDSLQPVELLDGVRVTQPQRKELLARVGAQRLLELLLQRL